MLKFTRRDIIITFILGEAVGLFSYAILREQAAASEATALVQGLAAHALTLPALALVVPAAAVIALLLTFLLGKRINPSFFQFGKFAVVGFSNTAINWGIVNLLIDPESASAAVFAGVVTIAFLVATGNSFVWNKFWAFQRKTTRHVANEAFVFYAITGGSLLINTGVATFMKSIGPDTALWAGIISLAAATGITMFWNFFGYKFIVFKHHASDPE